MTREPVETDPGRERAIVVALLLPGRPTLAHPTAEIRGLAEAAGAEVVGELLQRRRSPCARTAIGSGKVEELQAALETTEADLIVIDADLSPSQSRNLEKLLGKRIIDRTELILDIFASRAKTRQAKLQVSLAQAEYMMPRLRRLWTHLERTEGAIGTRGPGETQLETDRRLLSRRVLDLKKRLKEIAGRRERQARTRKGTTVSLVGYTNAGKSRLMAMLTGADVYIADQLFATLDTRVRTWSLRDGRDLLLADTVGFVSNLPHHLVASFHATLEETIHADLLLHVIDASDPDYAEHSAAVDKVLTALGADAIPRISLFNKIDRLDPVTRSALEDRHPEAIFLSALTGDGLEGLEAAVAGQMDQWSLHLELGLPAGAGKLIAKVRQVAVIEEERFEGESWCARVWIPPAQWGAVQAALLSEGGQFGPVAPSGRA